MQIAPYGEPSKDYPDPSFHSHWYNSNIRPDPQPTRGRSPSRVVHTHRRSPSTIVHTHRRSPSIVVPTRRRYPPSVTRTHVKRMGVNKHPRATESQRIGTNTRSPFGELGVPQSRLSDVDGPYESSYYSPRYGVQQETRDAEKVQHNKKKEKSSQTVRASESTGFTPSSTDKKRKKTSNLSYDEDFVPSRCRTSYSSSDGYQTEYYKSDYEEPYFESVTKLPRGI